MFEMMCIYLIFISASIFLIFKLLVTTGISLFQTFTKTNIVSYSARSLHFFGYQFIFYICQNISSQKKLMLVLNAKRTVRI